jgi:hypothetical protein
MRLLPDAEIMLDLSALGAERKGRISLVRTAISFGQFLVFVRKGFAAEIRRREPAAAGEQEQGRKNEFRYERAARNAGRLEGSA